MNDLQGDWLVYLGDQYTGAFSVNSRARPGRKLRVSPGVPFAIDPDDKWMLDLPGMKSLYLIDFVPKTIRIKNPDDTYLSQWEGAFLEGLASSLPDPARVVDLGTGQGCSLLRILTALSLHQDVHVWTFDLVECKDALELIHDAQIPRWRYAARLSDSAEAAGLVEPMVDMVYVDASHSGDGVERDIDAWNEKVKPGGVMAFHDYNNRKHGVTKPIRESMKRLKWKRVGLVGTLIAFEKPER
jgi:predicted O-methyltransferase YrrM